nr:ATP-binding protein [Altericroceibacterium xinjiangense]
MRRVLPRSLLGQMLLAVALALLVAQGLSAVLLYRAAEQRREIGSANALAFQLVAEPRFDFRQADSRFPRNSGHRRWQRLRVQRTESSPLLPGEEGQSYREELIREILIGQGIDPAELVVTTRPVKRDAYVMQRLRERHGAQLPDWAEGRLLLAALRRPNEDHWTVARLPMEEREPRQLGQLIAHTVVLYIVLVGLLALLLRRITRPLAALTQRLDTFAETRAIDGQLSPSGPEDTRRLIAAHNAMEARIIALLDEKDVMLGAIGHDLKTPLAALRVRIESVSDPAERAKMAASIEDITRSLDDILSLARVGRATDPLERTELAALTDSVVEEFEDMGDPVELEDTQRVALPLRATWLRRALRNLIGNALRYGERARVSVRREGDEAVIRIEDDGPGIPEGEIERMLLPFTRGDPSRSRGTGGAGLGLTLARAIAEQHGGTLTLTNRTSPDGSVSGLTAMLRFPLVS